jgi:hypothetical protein
MPAKRIDVNEHPALKGAELASMKDYFSIPTTTMSGFTIVYPATRARCTDIRQIRPSMVSKGNAS